MQDESLFLAIKIAKMGYFGGDPSAVLAAPVGVVMGVMHFEAFDSEFQQAVQAMNEG